MIFSGVIEMGSSGKKITMKLQTEKIPRLRLHTRRREHYELRSAG